MVVGIQNAHFTLRARQFNAFFVKPLPNGEQNVGEQAAKAVFGVVHPNPNSRAEGGGLLPTRFCAAAASRKMFIANVKSVA